MHKVKEVVKCGLNDLIDDDFNGCDMDLINGWELRL